jgi:pilin isopeptide linkage protein
MKNNIIFPSLSFDSPGVYSYTIKELSKSGHGWITDSRIYRVIITVKYNNIDKLTSSIDYPDGRPLFVNKYCRKNVCWCCGCCLSGCR